MPISCILTKMKNASKVRNSLQYFLSKERMQSEHHSTYYINCICSIKIFPQKKNLISNAFSDKFHLTVMEAFILPPEN